MKGKEKVVVIIVLVLLCLSVGIGLLLKERNKKDKEENTPIQSMEESVSTSYDSASLKGNEEARELIERIQDYDLLDYLETGEVLTNQEVLTYAIYILNYDYGVNISGEEVNDVVKKYFTFQNTNEDVTCMICGDIIYKYDSATNTYIYNPEHNGHAKEEVTPYNIIERYDSHEISNDDATITVYKAFSNNRVPTVDAETVYYSKISGGEKLFDVEYEEKEYNKPKKVTDVISEFRKIDNSKLTKVTYKLKKVDGIYVLESRKEEK